MISAKDEFFIEQEMLQELNTMFYDCGIFGEERSQILGRINTSQDYEREMINLQSGQMYLDKVRNGETLLQNEINKAVNKAANG